MINNSKLCNAKKKSDRKQGLIKRLISYAFLDFSSTFLHSHVGIDPPEKRNELIFQNETNSACLNQEDFQTFRAEFNLFKYNFKHLLYFNLYKSSGKRAELEIENIELDRNFSTFFDSGWISVLILITAYFTYLTFLINKG